MKINVPNGRGVAVFDVPDANLLGVYESSVNRVAPPTDAEAEVAAAIENPIGSPRLRELAKGQRNIVIIASDHTRPVPSKDDSDRDRHASRHDIGGTEGKVRR